MYKRAGTALIISGLTTLGVYRYRRGLVSRLLGLPPALHDVTVERGLRIPMPDGVELVADRYRPRQPSRFPTILVRTPYGRKASGFFVSHRMAERGYNVLVQDVRGRFDSEGDFDVFAGEDADGRATIRWIADQPWFDGSLGLWGMSYLAYVQWAAAPDAPSFLKAIMPQIGGSRAYPIIYSDGAFNLDLTLPYSILLEEQNTSPGASFLKSFLKSLLLQLRLRRRLRSGFMHLPVGKADAEVSGRPKTSYRDWLAHPEASDAYWRDRDHSRRVREVEAPARLFSGWYDFFLRELLDDYEALTAAGKTPHLTVGPYPHGSLGMMGEILRETFAWFDQHLKGETGRARTKPVHLYVMGADEWREFDAWPPPAEETHYHLHPGERLSPEAPPADSPPDHYRYDPADPTPAVGGPLFGFYGKRGAVDNRELESRPDVLVYTTPPLQREVEIVGPVRLELYVRSSLGYADFFGRLCDLRPDGKSINVCDGLFRLEPSQGEQQQDGSSRIEIDMWATAYRFRRGHSIRLQVSSGAHPRWNRNLGTGEPTATATTMLAAEQTIYHDREHPSAVILPVPGGPGRRA
jgi:putative CocE/NonD family hydrolase